MKMLVNRAGFTNGEVRTTLKQMALDITLESHAITAQEEEEGVPNKNPHASTMATRLRDFTWMNPPVYMGSMIDENLEEECRVAIIHESMVLSRIMVHVQQVKE